MPTSAAPGQSQETRSRPGIITGSSDPARHNEAMPAIPVSTKSSVTLRLLDHAETHWPQLKRVEVTYRGAFAYISGVLADGEQIPLRRLHLPPRRARPRARPVTHNSTPDELTGPPT